MKKFWKFLPFLLVALLVPVFTSCDDDDDNDKTISNNALPEAAKTFLNDYYPSIKYTTKRDDNGYDVTLANRHTVEFDWAGEWQDVDAPNGQTIPNGFFPAGIDIYIGEQLDGAGINEITRKKSANVTTGYEVELVNGRELLFTPNGDFVSYVR